MSTDRLKILYVSPMPGSPPRFGSQARIHGLMTEMARRHDLSAVILVDEDHDIEECRRAISEYCRHLVLIPNPHSHAGVAKRLLQLKSVLSLASFQRLYTTAPAMISAIEQLQRSTRFDIVNVEFPYLAYGNLRQAPPGERPPRIIVNSHEIAFDLARQFAKTGETLPRRMYSGINWRKLRKDELAAYAYADGVSLCSEDDQQRVLKFIPGMRSAVIPNAADIDYFKPRAADPKPDGRTVLFFGLLSTIPNIDGVRHLVNDIWPSIKSAYPDARLKIAGGRASPSLLALARPDVEFTGFVQDLRPLLASASAVVVPLRLGGGTRLKIVEAMAMGKAIVSTRLGAEGIEATSGRDIVLEDDAKAFAAAVVGLMKDPEQAAQMGRAARQLVEGKYSWSGAAKELEALIRRTMEAQQ